MADQLLCKKRRIFIHSVGAGTINALLDWLLEDRIISQEDMNKVRDENDTVMDKARVLIDLVIGKGPAACRKFIKHLCEEDPPLASKMGLHKAIAINQAFTKKGFHESTDSFMCHMGRVQEDRTLLSRNGDLWSQESLFWQLTEMTRMKDTICDKLNPDAPSLNQNSVTLESFEDMTSMISHLYLLRTLECFCRKNLRDSGLMCDKNQMRGSPHQSSTKVRRGEAHQFPDILTPSPVTNMQATQGPAPGSYVIGKDKKKVKRKVKHASVLHHTRTVGEKAMAADKVLKEKRKLFIRSADEGTINGLLDELLEKRVLNEEEMEKVKCENAKSMVKLCLMSLFGKGLGHAKFASCTFVKRIVTWQIGWILSR
ncbi:hypothetical protein P7K49_020755 [Saguinus oedipus]|uniref:CARD domain-containing protein n=1 Tax=Saguinus oedipus TaxID=9490 RepID=A0ABQ9UQP5_SAGOE|nr:hypothetical protein P7K49_020755 [Saguinus oedipus]